jgi:hypothetical protein
LADLSELDAAILRELQNNARRTNRAIAEAVHVAASTSLERTAPYANAASSAATTPRPTSPHLDERYKR